MFLRKCFCRIRYFNFKQKRMEFSQIRKIAQYSKISLPKQIMRENIRRLLKKDFKELLDSVDSRKYADELINAFGAFYIQSCYLGALQTISSTIVSDISKSSTNLTTQLSAEISFFTSSASESMKTGKNQGRLNKNLIYNVSTLGGNPTEILKGNVVEWLDSAKKNLACVDATFAPISSLTIKGSISEKYINESLDAYFKSKSDNLAKILIKLISTPISSP